MENKMSSFDREKIKKETNIKGEINSLYLLYFFIHFHSPIYFLSISFFYLQPKHFYFYFNS